MRVTLTAHSAIERLGHLPEYLPDAPVERLPEHLPVPAFAVAVVRDRHFDECVIAGVRPNYLLAGDQQRPRGNRKAEQNDQNEAHEDQ